MADFPQRFADKVIAEMRGFSDEQGRSPFWESLGRRFFSMDFAKADAISGLGSNQFIAELMPQHPIYVDMLSDDARQVIGQVHPDTRPALAMLKREGFRYQNYVDIFDAGPTIEVPKDQIKTYRASRLLPIRVGKPEGETESIMISNRRLQEFKTTVFETRIDTEELIVSAEVLDRLQVKEGDTVRAASLRNKR